MDYEREQVEAEKDAEYDRIARLVIRAYRQGLVDSDVLLIRRQASIALAGPEPPLTPLTSIEDVPF